MPAPSKALRPAETPKRVGIRTFCIGKMTNDSGVSDGVRYAAGTV